MLTQFTPVQLLRSIADKSKIAVVSSFFKNKKGEYSHGDTFIGVTVPNIRSIAREFYQTTTLEEVAEILKSSIHEERCLALLILVQKYQNAVSYQAQKDVVNFYIDENNIKHANNWDLVDLSCYKILGDFLLKNNPKADILYEFSTSPNIWIRRIAIVSTLSFIRANIFIHTLNLSQELLSDKHNLINKAVGWMLREVGKKDEAVLINFLKTHHKNMARITFSYSIEKIGRAWLS